MYCNYILGPRRNSQASFKRVKNVAEK